jgi:hypothetical protein
MPVECRTIRPIAPQELLREVGEVNALPRIGLSGPHG